MRRVDILKRAGKNLRKAKLRTILTALAIAVGATTISLALSAGKGGNSYVDSLASKIGDQRSIGVFRKPEEKSTVDPYELKTEGQAESSENSILAQQSAQYSLNTQDVEKIAKIDGVESVNPVVVLSIDTVRLEDGEKFMVGAISKNDSSPVELSAGEKKEITSIDSGKTIAPKSFAKATGLSEKDLLGKKVIFSFKNLAGQVFERTFTISGVDNGKTEFEFNYPNAFRIANEDAVNIVRLQDEAAANSFYGIFVSVKSGANVQQVAEKIRELDSSRYNAYSFEDNHRSVQTAINVMAAGLAGFGALTLLASVFGIINTQYISVLERTSQIGLMKSLGMRKSEVSKLFRYEAALIGLFGGLIGVTVAYGFTFLNPVINEFFRSSGGRGVDVNLLQPDFMAWGLLIIGLMIISIISGYLPARKAARMNPIEALRTE